MVLNSLRMGTEREREKGREKKKQRGREGQREAGRNRWILALEEKVMESLSYWGWKRARRG